MGVTNIIIMKNIVLLALLMSITFNLKAQDKGGGVVAAAMGLAGIGAVIASKEKIKEMAELGAAQFLLRQDLEGTNFYLKLLDLDAEKGSSDSSAGITSFMLTTNNTIDGGPAYGGKKFKADGKKHIMLFLSLTGRVNEFGTMVNRDKWLFLGFDDWLDIFSEYVMLASFQKDKESVKKLLISSKLVSGGIEQDDKLVVPFFTLNGDTYISKDYDNEYKLIYNEKSLGLYVKDSRDLLLLGRKDMARIHEFFIADN